MITKNIKDDIRKCEKRIASNFHSMNYKDPIVKWVKDSLKSVGIIPSDKMIISGVQWVIQEGGLEEVKNHKNKLYDFLQAIKTHKLSRLLQAITYEEYKIKHPKTKKTENDPIFQKKDKHENKQEKEIFIPGNKNNPHLDYRFDTKIYPERTPAEFNQNETKGKKIKQKPEKKFYWDKGQRYNLDGTPLLNKKDLKKTAPESWDVKNWKAIDLADPKKYEKIQEFEKNTPSSKPEALKMLLNPNIKHLMSHDTPQGRDNAKKFLQRQDELADAGGYQNWKKDRGGSADLKISSCLNWLGILKGNL